MTTAKRRRELACHWFSMDFIINAFKEIKDSEFETVSSLRNSKLKTFFKLLCFLKHISFSH